MRTALVLAALVVLVSPPAMAGEVYLGKIVSTAGADTTNATTATPFYLSPVSKISMFCNASAYVITDTTTAVTDSTGANPGLPLAAWEKFPSSLGTMVRITSTLLSDGGVNPANGGAVLRIGGAGAVTCHIYSRRGDE